MSPQKYRKNLIIFLILFCAAAGSLYSLHQRHAPWVLKHTFPSGLDESDYLGSWRATSTPPAFDLHPDGKQLLIGRYDHQAEIRDLETGTLLRRIQVPHEKELSGDKKGLDGIHYAQYLDENRILLGSENKMYLIKGDTAPVHVAEEKEFYRSAAASPDGQLLAYTSQNQVQVYHLNSREWAWFYDLESNNGSHKLHWSADSSRLLLKDLSGLWLFDTHDGTLLWSRPELDFRREWPHFADELSGFASQPDADIPGKLPRDDSQLAGVNQAILTAHGIHCIATYANPRLHRVDATHPPLIRKYNTLNGEIVWEQKLEISPQSILLSQDETRVIVQTTPDFNEQITLLDAGTGETIDKLSIEEAYNHYPGRIALSPDNRSLLAVSTEAWSFSLNNQTAPFRLIKRSNTAVPAWLDENRILLYGRETTVRIYERTRPLSPRGLWVYWETILLYMLGFGMGLRLLLISGHQTEKETGIKLPWQLWIVIGLMMTSKGTSLAGDAIDIFTREFYDPEYTSPRGWHLFFHLLFESISWWALYSLMRLSRGWYLFTHTFYVLTFTVLLVLTGIVISKFNGSELPDPASIPIYNHAWIMNIPVNMIPAFMVLALTISAGTLILLRTYAVKTLYVKRWNAI